MGAVWIHQDAELARLRALVDLKDIQLKKVTEDKVRAQAELERAQAELERTLSELGRTARELAKLRGPLPPVEYAARREPYGDDPMYLGEG